VIPELPEINSGFVRCYPKFPNKIRVSGISGSGSSILGSGYGYFASPTAEFLNAKAKKPFTPYKYALFFLQYFYVK
jgi:hypothetical protein